MFSVLAAGWLSDRLGLNGRALLMFLGLTGAALALLLLMGVHPGNTSSLFPVLMIGIVAFCLLGPYSYLGGAFALDFGGKQASAASSRDHRRHRLHRRGACRRHRGADCPRLRLGGVFVSLAVVSAVAALCAERPLRPEHQGGKIRA